MPSKLICNRTGNALLLVSDESATLEHRITTEQGNRHLVPVVLGYYLVRSAFEYSLPGFKPRIQRGDVCVKARRVATSTSLLTLELLKRRNIPEAC